MHLHDDASIEVAEMVNQEDINEWRIFPVNGSHSLMMTPGMPQSYSNIMDNLSKLPSGLYVIQIINNQNQFFNFGIVKL